MANGFSLILPAYSEAENLKAILPQIVTLLKELALPYEVLVIDTVEPTDNTAEICKVNGAICINRSGKNSYGSAIRTGIAFAKYSKIGVMDADGSHNPKDLINLFLKSQEGYDICIGSRYVQNGKTENDFILTFLSRCLNLFFQTVFGLNVKDTSNSLRVYDAEILKKIKIEGEDFDLVEEILIKLVDSVKDLKLAELPISFNKRAAGESKRNSIPFLISYFKTIIRLLKEKAKCKK